MSIRGRKMADIKQSNRRAILRMLHEEGAMSRKRLAQRLSLTPAAITLIVADLIEEGLLYEGETIVQSGTAGRREINLEINASRYVALGAAINIDEYILSVVTLSGVQIGKERLDPLVNADAEAVCNYIGDRLLIFAKQHVPEGAQIVGLGVSVRGIVDSQRGISIDSLGVWAQKDVDVKAYFEEFTPWRTIVNNNVHSIARAQMFLSRDPSNGNMLFIRSVQGIGAALTIDYKLLEGTHHRSGEIGHVCVEKDGLPCVCGERGCLETVASYQAIISQAQGALSETATPQLYALTGGKKDRVTFDLIDEAAARGDAPIAGIWNRAITLSADVLRMAIRLVDSQKIVLYGKMFENERYLNSLRMALEGEQAFQMTDMMIVKSSMNQVLDAIAAPILAVRDFIERGGMG